MDGEARRELVVEGRGDRHRRIETIGRSDLYTSRPVEGDSRVLVHMI